MIVVREPHPNNKAIFDLLVVLALLGIGKQRKIQVGLRFDYELEFAIDEHTYEV